MAEVVGLAASIVALLELTVTATSFLQSVKDGSKECAKLRLAVRSAEAILKTLQETVDEVESEDRASWASTISSLGAPEGPLEQLRDTMTSLNKILAKAPSGPMKLMWPFKKVEVDKLLKDIQGQVQLLNLALENDHIALSKAIHANTEDIKGDIQRLTLAEDCKEQEAILSWITALDFSAQLNQRLGERQQGTGRWFLNCSEFQCWKEKPGETLLCPGPPGAGKTVMSSVVISDLMSVSQNSRRFGIAYLFCSYQPGQQPTMHELLSCLLGQLCRQLETMPDVVKASYEAHRRDKIHLSKEELYDALSDTISHFARCYVVVDAIDEYYVAQRTASLQLLSTLFSLQQQSPFNVLVTSRPISEISSMFENCARREITAAKDDMLQYIIGRMPALLGGSISKYPDVQDLIRTGIIRAADGM